MPTYKDLSFSFKKHPLTGDLLTKTDAQAIRQSIKNLISTRAYSRGFNVDIHCGIDDLLFENFTPILQHELKREIENVLTVFENRINLKNIEIYNNDYELVVTIMYSILNNDNLEKIDFILEQVN